MSQQVQPIPVRKPRSRATRALQGTGVTLALLAGLEVALAVIGEGAVSPTVKLLAQALSLGIGAAVGAMKGT
jgi:hypothetical protein